MSQNTPTTPRVLPNAPVKRALPSNPNNGTLTRIKEDGSSIINRSPSSSISNSRETLPEIRSITPDPSNKPPIKKMEPRLVPKPRAESNASTSPPSTANSPPTKVQSLIAKQMASLNQAQSNSPPPSKISSAPSKSVAELRQHIQVTPPISLTLSADNNPPNPTVPPKPSKPFIPPKPLKPGEVEAIQEPSSKSNSSDGDITKIPRSDSLTGESRPLPPSKPDSLKFSNPEPPSKTDTPPSPKIDSTPSPPLKKPLPPTKVAPIPPPKGNLPIPPSKSIESIPKVEGSPIRRKSMDYAPSLAMPAYEPPLPPTSPKPQPPKSSLPPVPAKMRQSRASIDLPTATHNQQNLMKASSFQSVPQVAPPRAPSSPGINPLDMNCSKCGKGFEKVEVKMSAKGKLWHKNCFVCASCNQAFSESYATVDGNPYHIKCLCGKCKKPFTAGEPKLNAQTSMWHKDCFSCQHCSKPLSTSYVLKSNKSYHEDCWFESAQGTPITASNVVLIDDVNQQYNQNTLRNIQNSPESNPAPKSNHSRQQSISNNESSKLKDVFKLTKLTNNIESRYSFLRNSIMKDKKDPPPTLTRSNSTLGQSTENLNSPGQLSKEEQKKIKKEEDRKKAQLKKEEKDKKKELKKEKKLQQKQKEIEAKKKDKLLQSKKVGAYNGVIAKALVDQLSFEANPHSNKERDSIDSILSFKVNDLIYITDTRMNDNMSTTATLRMGGGSGIMIGYCSGRQGFVPTHFIELMEPGDHDDDQVLLKKMLKLLVAPDMLVALSLCSVVPREEFALLSKAFVALYETNGNILDFIHILLQNEIAQTMGSEYLVEVLSPLVEMISNYEHSLEVDPSKSKEDVSENSPYLKEVAQNFFNAIISSADRCPEPIKNICYLLATEVSTKFPDSKHVSVGGFIFLRAFTPAVVSPENFGVITELNPKARRPLVLISKILQNVSNDRDFKEEFMQPLNSFISENSVLAKNFFDEMSREYFDGATKPMDIPLMECMDKDTLLKLHQQLNFNLSKIGKEIELMREVIQLEDNPFETLLPIMNQLGPPNVPKASFIGADKGIKPFVVQKTLRGQNKDQELTASPRQQKTLHSSINLPPAHAPPSIDPAHVIDKMNWHASTQFLPTMNFLIDFFEDRDIITKNLFVKNEALTPREKEIINDLEKGQLPKFSDLDEVTVVGLLQFFMKFLLEPFSTIGETPTEFLGNHIRSLPTFPTLKNLFILFHRLLYKIDTETFANSLKNSSGISSDLLKKILDHRNEIFEWEASSASEYRYEEPSSSEDQDSSQSAMS